MKNWLAMLTLLKGIVMPKYVSANNSKYINAAIFQPKNSNHTNKNSVVKKIMEILHGDYRRNQLEKALLKLNTEELIMLGMIVDRAIEKEVENRLN